MMMLMNYLVKESVGALSFLLINIIYLKQKFYKLLTAPKKNFILDRDDTSSRTYIKFPFFATTLNPSSPHILLLIYRM